MKEPLHSRRIWKRLACLAAMLFCVAAAGVPALAQEATETPETGNPGYLRNGRRSRWKHQ